VVFKRNKERETLPEGDAKQQAVREMFDTIASRYDLVNRVMTFRLDTKWRKIAIESLQLSTPSRVLDLASGTGDLCLAIQKRGHTAISVDLSYGMLSFDRSGAPRAQADILRLPFPESSVDAVICGFALRNLVDLSTFFVEIARVLKPGGRVVLLDVGIPHNPIIRFGNNIYFGKIVPKIGALLSDRDAYRYLPRSVAYLPPRAELTAMLRAAGFNDAEHRQLSGGLTQLLSGTRNQQ
jgi:demethylmenaquinone methyltransferase/2-methoxy-6-polyprenyl-1,4-benzoquinol methylase